MRIRSHIFISVFLATVLPLFVLALAASYYSEYNYQREIKREIITNLDGMTIEISHELQNARNLVLGISRAAPIKSFIPTLTAIAQGTPLPYLAQSRKKIDQYFEGFQTILPGEFTLRLLDYRGDTLVKVTHNKTSQPQYENLVGVRYVEPQITSSDFVQKLQKIHKNEVSFLSLPHHFFENENDLELPYLDYAVPLYKNEQWVGTLVVTLSAEQIDRIINNTARLYKGKLIIAENNPDNFNRHGLLLYDEKNNLHVSDIRSSFFTLQKRVSPHLFLNIIDNPNGVLKQNDSRFYFSEFFPYPNRLIGWIVATQIDAETLSAPFASNRLTIWLFSATALFFTLILTGFAVRKISKPICSLASQLKIFADGKDQWRAEKYQSISEIQALSSSFNYMADTLVRAQSERDKAQNMVLQSNKLASIGQMAAGIGHEINNPLNNILSYSTLISRTIAKTAADIDTKTLSNLQRDIDALRSETLRASEIIKGILNFARQMPPQLAVFSIKKWLEKSISLIQQTAKARHIDVQLHYNGDDNYEGDQAQLQQVIVNLLLNAIQASEDNTVIDVNVNMNVEYLNVTIHDHGTGINEEDLDKIYDPFFTTKEEGDGTGLGLSISLGIIESHHGELVIKNNSDLVDLDDNKGATAILFLPIN